ncbi:MAG: universal stress protein [Planctomycetia bacterium]
MASTRGPILVTTDLSPLGDEALAHATELARAQGLPLVLLSVVEVPSTPNALYAHYYPTPTPAQLAEAHKKLEGQLGERAARAKAAGVKVEVQVREGEAAAEIAKAAGALSPSVLVISTHGRTGLKHFLLGSVAERVLRGTKCPVLLVR